MVTGGGGGGAGGREEETWPHLATPFCFASFKSFFFWSVPPVISLGHELKEKEKKKTPIPSSCIVRSFLSQSPPLFQRLTTCLIDVSSYNAMKQKTKCPRDKNDNEQQE